MHFPVPQIQEQIVDVPVPQIMEETDEVAKLNQQERIQQRTLEETVTVPLPRIQQQIFEVVKAVPSWGENGRSPRRARPWADPGPRCCRSPLGKSRGLFRVPLRGFPRLLHCEQFCTAVSLIFAAESAASRVFPCRDEQMNAWICAPPSTDHDHVPC